MASFLFKRGRAENLLIIDYVIQSKQEESKKKKAKIKQEETKAEYLGSYKTHWGER